MKALVIGQGGREHALVRALKLSPSVSEVHAAPGSDGMKQDARCHPVTWKDFAGIQELVAREKIDFVVIGPEDPLVAGLSDALRANGTLVVAPGRDAAQLEGSKIFCKEFLNEAKIPTARSFTVSTVEQTLKSACEFAPPYVLKADGLAAGKGVFICKTLASLETAAHSLFVARTLGDSGARALLEEFSPGYEISYLVLTNGEVYEPLPLAQDHKRLLDGDEGPNTGGMGVVAPIKIDDVLRARIDREVVVPTIAHLKKRGFVYRGVLFIGLMMTEQGPSVLEFNTRFGDPETQAVLPLLDGDWGITLRELAAGRLSKLKWTAMSSCSLVLAAEGYPDAPVKGTPIEGLAAALAQQEPVRSGRQANVEEYFLHAGTKLDEKKGWVTYGGRVLNSVAVAPTLNEAMAQAYEQARRLVSPGMQMRSDIGKNIS
jgi:phosphoribosylamine--glycine ligase